MYVCRLDEDAYALMVPIILHTDLCISVGLPWQVVM